MKSFSAKIVLIFLLLSIFLNLLPHKISADVFAQTSVRIDRQKISSNSGGQVCATVPSFDNGTETNVQIIFPSNFTVNTTASNWTTNTSNLPAGSIAWPGIGTATAINGQIVTFPSSDLSINTMYCFNFASVNTLTLPSTAGNYEGTLRTRAANTVIDSQEFGLSVVANDQITVTATVPAQPTDFQAQLELSSHPNGTFPQETTLTYTLTYGSYLSYPISITPQVSWDLGTITGSGTPTVNLLNYVSESASDAYGGVAPVIDTTNRTISWDITALPANTLNQTVTFKLKTNASYTGSSVVQFTVNGRTLGPGTQTADSSVISAYKYNIVSSGSGDGRSDGRSDNRSSALQPSTFPLAISGVEVRSVSDSNVTIFTSTNKNSKISLSYGTSKNNLNKTIVSNEISTQHLLDLKELKENTRYYFKILAENTSEKDESDLYTFITASTSNPVTISLETLIILSQNVILYDAHNPPINQKKEAIPSIVIPKNKEFSIKFNVQNYDLVKNISIFTKNNGVLGINNFVYIKPGSDSNALVEISPGQYLTSLTSNKENGIFSLIASIEDFNGNISQQTLAITRIVDPLRIIESDNKKPIENAKVTLSSYNPRTRRFELLSPAIVPINNPSSSEPDGTIYLVLPHGSYRSEVTALGYEGKTVDFTINQSENDGYPVIELKKLPFNLLTTYSYFQGISVDLLQNGISQFDNVKTSNRFYDFIIFFALINFSYLLLISLSERFRIPIRLIPWFFLYHTTLLFGQKKHENIIQGIVFDKNTHETIPHTLVYISLPNGKILAHTHTNSSGEFFATATDHDILKITVSHKGYKIATNTFSGINLKKRLEINLLPLKKKKSLSFQGIDWYTNFILSSLFEAIILITILIEAGLVLQFGILRLLPFIVLSVISLFIWASHKRHVRLIADS